VLELKARSCRHDKTKTVVSCAIIACNYFMISSHTLIDSDSPAQNLGGAIAVGRHIKNVG